MPLFINYISSKIFTNFHNYCETATCLTSTLWYSFIIFSTRETINQLKMPESCTSRFLVQSVLSYEKMLSQQKKKKNSNLRILFDVSKEHIRKLEVHPSDSAFWSTSFMQVCYEGKKRKIICVIHIWCVQCIGSDCSYVLFCMLHP